MENSDSHQVPASLALRARHLYIEVYPEHLARLRRSARTVLEIGIGGYDRPGTGRASLRMWQGYFPKAQVIGIDIEPKQVDEPR